MFLGLEWLWQSPIGLTALLMMFCCFFAGVFQWARINKKIDSTGYVKIPYGPYGLLSKSVALRKAPKALLEEIIADRKASDQEVPQALLDALEGKLPNGLPGEPAAGLNPATASAEVLPHETKEAGNSSGVSASANSGSPEAPIPELIEAIDPELAAMLKPHALSAGNDTAETAATAVEAVPSVPPSTPKPSPQQAPNKKRRWPCPYCPGTYASGNSLSNHIKAWHPKQHKERAKARKAKRR